jgi:aryl-alcohol dehydrogenase-like predicted oxidoreductase
MTFGSQVDEASAGGFVDSCLEQGINFFDTANVYNAGRSEEILGKCLKGRRDQVVLASKVRGKTPTVSGLSRSAIKTAVEESLTRLQTDHLDIYYLHQPDYDVPIEESLEAVESLVKAGKVRYPASSNYAAWQVNEMLCLAGGSKYKPAYVTQPMYNLLARGIEQEYLPMCKRFGVSTCVYNPLAGGLLTGKQQIGAPISGTRFDSNQMYLDRYWHPAYFEAVDELKKVADAAGRSLVSLALNWLLHHTATDCVILGASRLEQLKQNMKAISEGALTADTLAACDRVWQKLRGVTPQYNR